MIDILSYIMGLVNGSSEVVITGGVNCTDDGDGNITVTEE